MNKFLFKPTKNGGYVDIEVNGVLTYRWPLSSPDRRFTTHLLSKLLSPVGQHRVLVLKMQVLAFVDHRALDFYLPPAYRPIPQKPSIWSRFVNLFKEEKHHARTHHAERTQ